MSIWLLNVAAEEEMPLIKELWLYFYETYFAPTEYYEHLDLGAGSMLSLRLIILGLCIGLPLAAFATVFNKRVLGGFVRRLIREEAFSPESAKTLHELGYAKSLVLHFAVKRSTALRRVVKSREEEDFERELAAKREAHEAARKNGEALPRFKEVSYKMDAYTDSFYIPEKMRYMADVKFEEKGTTWRGAIVFSIVMVIVFIAILVALPHVLELLNDFVGSLNA